MRLITQICIIALLAGCSLKYPNTAKPVHREHNIKLLGNAEGCSDAYANAQHFYRLHGVKINDQYGDKHISCLEPIAGILRFMVSVLNLGTVRLDGAAEIGGTAGYFHTFKNQPEHTTKIAIHEIGHLLGLEHGILGLMTFDANLLYLATSLSKKSKRELYTAADKR